MTWICVFTDFLVACFLIDETTEARRTFVETAGGRLRKSDGREAI